MPNITANSSINFATTSGTDSNGTLPTTFGSTNIWPSSLTNVINSGYALDNINAGVTLTVKDSTIAITRLGTQDTAVTATRGTLNCDNSIILMNGELTGGENQLGGRQATSYILRDTTMYDTESEYHFFGSFNSAYNVPPVYQWENVNVWGAANGTLGGASTFIVFTSSDSFFRNVSYWNGESGAVIGSTVTITFDATNETANDNATVGLGTWDAGVLGNQSAADALLGNIGFGNTLSLPENSIRIITGFGGFFQFNSKSSSSTKSQKIDDWVENINTNSARLNFSATRGTGLSIILTFTSDLRSFTFTQRDTVIGSITNTAFAAGLSSEILGGCPQFGATLPNVGTIVGPLGILFGSGFSAGSPEDRCFIRISRGGVGDAGAGDRTTRWAPFGNLDYRGVGTATDAAADWRLCVDDRANAFLINPLPGRPSTLASITFRAYFGTAARARMLVGSNPTTTSTQYNKVVFPTALEVFNPPLTKGGTDVVITPLGGNAANVIESPTNGFWITSQDYIAANSDFNTSNFGRTGGSIVAINTLQTFAYRTYKWDQQPTNATFGREISLAGIADNATDAQVLTARTNGYDEVSTDGVTWTTTTPINDPLDAIVSENGITYETAVALNGANSISSLDLAMFYAKAQTILRSVPGAHFDLLYTPVGATLQLDNAFFQFDGTRTINATSKAGTADNFLLAASSTVALGAITGMRALATNSFVQFSNGALPPSDFTMEGRIRFADTATVLPAFTMEGTVNELRLRADTNTIDFSNLNFTGSGVLNLVNIANFSGTGTLSISGTNPGALRDAINAGAHNGWSTIVFLENLGNTTFSIPADLPSGRVILKQRGSVAGVNVTETTHTTGAVTTLAVFTNTSGSTDTFDIYYKPTNVFGNNGVFYLLTKVSGTTNAAMDQTISPTSIEHPNVLTVDAENADLSALSTTWSTVTTQTTATININGAPLQITAPQTLGLLMRSTDDANYLRLLANREGTSDFILPLIQSSSSVNSVALTLSATSQQIITATAGVGGGTLVATFNVGGQDFLSCIIIPNPSGLTSAEAEAAARAGTTDIRGVTDWIVSQDSGELIGIAPQPAYVAPT